MLTAATTTTTITITITTMVLAPTTPKATTTIMTSLRPRNTHTVLTKTTVPKRARSATMLRAATLTTTVLLRL